jgi:hypothetical protein
MARKPFLPPLGTKPQWHVTVLDRGGREIIAHETGEDEKESQIIASKWRSKSLDYKIWIRPPAGKLFPWW